MTLLWPPSSGPLAATMAELATMCETGGYVGSLSLTHEAPPPTGDGASGRLPSTAALGGGNLQQTFQLPYFIRIPTTSSKWDLNAGAMAAWFKPVLWIAYPPPQKKSIGEGLFKALQPRGKPALWRLRQRSESSSSQWPKTGHRRRPMSEGLSCSEAYR